MNVQTWAWGALSIAVNAAIASNSAIANGAESLEQEEVLVQGSALGHELVANSSQVFIISKQTIENLNPSSLTELLRVVPGLHINQQGGPGGISAVHIRGGEANFIAYMVDGVRINTPTNTRGGSYDLSSIPLSAIESIEVIKGPQSGRYGSDALSGVINIVTKSSVDKTTIALELGSGDFVRASVTGGMQAGERVSFAANADYKKVDGLVQGDSFESRSFGFKGRISPTDAGVVNISAHYIDKEFSAYPQDSGGPEFALIDAQDQNEQQDWTLGLEYRHTFSEAFNTTFYANRFDHHAEVDSPGVAPFTEIPPNGNIDDYQRDTFGVRNAWALSSVHTLGLDLEYSDESGESEGYLNFGFELPTSFDLARDQISATLGWYANFESGLGLLASSRLDQFSSDDSETTFQFGIQIPLNAINTTLSSNWGQAYKLPSFFALGHSLTGNPDLQPEESESFDIGFKTEIVKNKLVSEVNFFRSDYENLIDFDAESFRNVNRDSVSTEGVELSFNYALNERVRGQASVTYLDIDAEPGVILRSRPNVSGGMAIFADINDALNVSVNYRHQGTSIEASRHTGSTVFESLAAYDVVSLNIAWAVHKGGELRLALDNVLDSDHQDAVGFPNPGFVSRLAYQLSF